MMSANPLATLTAATTALAQAKTLDEVKRIVDVAEAARTYARAAKLGLEAQNHAAEIKLRAERKAGELLKAMKEAGELAEQGRPKTLHDETFCQPLKLADLGVTRIQAHRWEAVAAVPVETLEEYIAERKAGGEEITTSAVYQVARRVERREERAEKINEIAKSNTPLASGLDRLYPVIYADPPWRYEHSVSDSREIENQYPTMSLPEICGLPVSSIATPDAVLFLWTTSPKLAESIQVIEAWGFIYRTCIVWDKERIGMGYYARQQHELLLIATRGEVPTPQPKNRPGSVIRIRRDEEHSRKPQEFYKLIERMYPEYDKIELFARNQQLGWAVWGNQA